MPRAFASESGLRCLVRVGGFVASSVLVLGAANAWAERAFGDRSGAVFEPVFGATPFEAIVLGSSHAVHGIQPRSLDGAGLRFFNSARQGATPRYLRWWYDLYRGQGRRPRLVVHDADWFLFSAFIERRPEHEAGHLPWPSLAAMAMAPGADHRLMFANAFALTRDRLKIQLSLTGRASTGPARAFDDRGWLAWTAPSGPGAFAAYAHDPALFAVRAEQVAALGALYDALAADGVRVVMIQSPEHRPDDPAIRAAQARLAAFAASRRVPFLNYNADRRRGIAADARNFGDWGHLGEAGARAFTEVLKRDLVAMGVYGQSREAR